MPTIRPRNPAARVLPGLVAALLVTLFVAAPAQADFRGFTWNRASVELGPRFASDDLEFGLGVDGGYTLDQGIYLGGLFNYFFGDDNANARFGVAGAGVEVNWSAWFLMAEGGYDFGVADQLVLRPTAAIGVATANVELCGTVPGLFDGCSDESDSDMQGAVGGYLIYNLSGVTLGGELRLMFGDFDGGWLGLNVGF